MLEEKETLPEDPVGDTIGGDGNEPLLDTGEDTKSMEIIRNGLNLDKNFWENFIKICNNEGIADLLNVKPYQISEWVPRIRLALKRVEESDRQQKKDKMINTGNATPETPKTIGGSDDAGTIENPNDIMRPTP